ncbi:hypothetical protein ILUMI_01865, partial [Ignelater luminosus]
SKITFRHSCNYILVCLSTNNYYPLQLNLTFFQKDYDIKMDILEVPLYNKSHFKYVEAGLVWYNRTQRAISAKWEYSYDPRNNSFIEVQLYKMMSNEYRFFPLTFKTSLCTEYKKNSFGMNDLLTRYSNVNLCDLRKGITYTMNKIIPDFSKFPPHLPVGSYKLLDFCFIMNFRV